MFKTMSDVPTASTSTASTSSESPASTSKINTYTFRCLTSQDLDCTTTEESESSTDTDSESSDEVSSYSNGIGCVTDDSDNNMDETSWSSHSDTPSCEDKTTSENSETENLILKERLAEEKLINDAEKLEASSPILILVQVLFTLYYYTIIHCSRTLFIVLNSQKLVEIAVYTQAYNEKLN